MDLFQAKLLWPGKASYYYEAQTLLKSNVKLR